MQHRVSEAKEVAIEAMQSVQWFSTAEINA